MLIRESEHKLCSQRWNIRYRSIYLAKSAHIRYKLNRASGTLTIECQYQHQHGRVWSASIRHILSASRFYQPALLFLQWHFICLPHSLRNRSKRLVQHIHLILCGQCHTWHSNTIHVPVVPVTQYHIRHSVVAGAFQAL